LSLNQQTSDQSIAICLNRRCTRIEPSITHTKKN